MWIERFLEWILINISLIVFVRNFSFFVYSSMLIILEDLSWKFLETLEIKSDKIAID